MMTHPTNIQLQKLEDLRNDIKRLNSVAVSFSGGVDSSFLLRVAADVLGGNAIAVTICSPFFPQRESDEAQAFCGAHKIRQVMCERNVLEIAEVARNPKDRCYHCKKEMFRQIRAVAQELGMEHVIEGSNTDDDGDYRPGMLAVAELGIISPLKDCGLTKADIRALSKYLGLPTWEKPSFACLASRFAYGEKITEEKLSMVERAEQLLFDRGFRQFRVRIHGSMARIEVEPEEFARIMQEEVRTEIAEKFRAYGFTYTTLDLDGYRIGSMNEELLHNGGIEGKISG